MDANVEVDFENQRSEVLCCLGSEKGPFLYKDIYELERLLDCIRSTIEKVKKLMYDLKKEKVRVEEIRLRIEDCVNKSCVIKLMYRERLSEMVKVVEKNPVEGCV